MEPKDTTVFTVKKKIGKPFKVEVPNEMIKELKNEYMSNVVMVGGGAYDKIEKYLLKKYGGTPLKNKHVHQALEIIEKHATELAKEEKKGLPQMDRLAIVVISNPAGNPDILLIDIPAKNSGEISQKLKTSPEEARDDLKSLFSYLGYPVNDRILDAALADIKNGGKEPVPVIDAEGNKHSMQPYTAIQTAMDDSKKIIDFVQKLVDEAKKRGAYTKKADYYLEKAAKAYAAASYTYAKILALKAVESIKISKVVK